VENQEFILFARCQWLTLVILATWKTEIRKIMVQGQPGQIAHKIPSPKITRAKMERCGSSGRAAL
jgi:hypothetical protein